MVEYVYPHLAPVYRCFVQNAQMDNVYNVPMVNIWIVVTINVFKEQAYFVYHQQDHITQTVKQAYMAAHPMQ